MKRINGTIKKVWGISEVGFSIMSVMETSFLLYFLTDVARLPLSLAAAISGSSAVADAVCAVFAGIVIDKVHLRAGKYRPWLLWCPPVASVFFIFCFTKIGGPVTSGLVIIVAYVASHFVWTIAWTANRNLISVLTDDPGEKDFLSARIAIGTTLGKITASFLVPLFSSVVFAGIPGVKAYTLITAIACCCYVACYLVHYRITAGWDRQVSAGGKPVYFRNILRGVVSNRHLTAILLHDTIRQTAYYGVAAAAAHYAKIVWNDPGAVTWLLVVFYIGTTVGAGLSNRLAGQFGVRATCAVGCCGCGICMLTAYFLPTVPALLTACLFLAQVCFGAAYGLTSKLYTMCSAYSQWKTGEDTRGAVMACSSLAIKLAIAVRGMMITAVLGWIHYDPEITMIPQQAVGGIRFLFFAVFGAVMLVSILPLAMFRLDDKQVGEMEAEITARK